MINTPASSTTQFATWNVNSLTVRLPHVLTWLKDNPVDVLCLQELKLTDDRFPIEALKEAGYQAIFMGQKTYNGVAIITPLSQPPVSDIQYNLPYFDDEQKRFIAVTLHNGTRVMCAYIPNGQAVDSDKYQYKLGWLKALTIYIQEQIKRYPKLVLGGDYNIAPTDDDVYDPTAWADAVLCSAAERLVFNQLLAMGLNDAYRLIHPNSKETCYTWWDYRQLGFQKNKGLRIDHWLISDVLRQSLSECNIDKIPRKWQQPSDHAPVIMTLQSHNT